MPPCCDGGQAFAAAGAELLGADHQMVRRQRQHRLGALVPRVGRSGGHRRPRIAARRLDQDVDLHADVPGLLLGHEAVGVVGGDHRPGEQARGRPTRSRVCWKVDCLPEQRHELLGHALARQRPQALAGASDQDDGRDQRHDEDFQAEARAGQMADGEVAADRSLQGLRCVPDVPRFLLAAPPRLDLDRFGKRGNVRGDLVEVAGIEDQQRGRPGWSPPRRCAAGGRAGPSRRRSRRRPAAPTRRWAGGPRLSPPEMKNIESPGSPRRTTVMRGG